MKYVLRYPTRCPRCGALIPEGATALWDHRFGIESCLKCYRAETCGKPTPKPTPDLTDRQPSAKLVEDEGGAA